VVEYKRGGVIVHHGCCCLIDFLAKTDDRRKKVFWRIESPNKIDATGVHLANSMSDAVSDFPLKNFIVYKSC
jgi:hypothetical protein